MSLTAGVGLVPYAFVGVVVLALLADFWLYRTRAGLALRAVGLDATSSRRLGMPTGRTILIAFVVSGVFASLGGALLAYNTTAVVSSQFTFQLALVFVIMTVVGGLRSRAGFPPYPCPPPKD